MSDVSNDVTRLVDDIVARHDRTTTLDDFGSLWETLSAAGLTRVGIDENCGGSGGDLHDLRSVVERLGWHGVSVPVVESNVAEWALSTRQPLPLGPATFALVTSATRATLTLSMLNGDSGTATGRIPRAPWARLARTLVIGIRGSQSPALVAVDLGHPTVATQPRENLAGEPLDDVVLDHTPVTFLTGWPRTEELAWRVELLRLARLHGACQGTVAITKDHVAHRCQFGKPLRDLPAVAARVAGQHIHLVQATAALERALEMVAAVEPLDDDSPPLRIVAALAAARVVLAASSTEIAHIAHEMHGAIGTTWEHRLHHLTRRIWSWRDHGTSARRAQQLLGHLAMTNGEDAMWRHLTH